MPVPHMQEFSMPDGQELTSIVMDQSDFDVFCNDLEACGLTGVTKETIDRIRIAKHLPMMGRGVKTEQFFERYGAKTDLLSVMVRGQGINVIGKYLS